MGERSAGLIKIAGITALLLVLWSILVSQSPLSFLTANNLENLLRRTALYGVLGIGVAFVVISSGIDLSIGSLVCLSACLLALFLQVDYVAVGQVDVYQVRSADQTFTVAADHGFSVGDRVWFEKDRRNKGLFTIAEIQSDQVLGQQTVAILKLDAAPKRDLDLEETEDASPNVGTLSPTFDVTKVAGAEVLADASFPTLRHNDKILFVHPTASSREKVVDQLAVSETGVDITLNDTDAGLDESFQAVPIRKTPLMSIPAALASVLGITLVLGLLHGLLITKLRMQPFVVTLCGLLIYRGLSRWLTNDQTVGFIEYRESLGQVASGRWETGLYFKPQALPAGPEGESAGWEMIWDPALGAESFGIPYPFFIFAFLVIAAMIFLNLTVWGRHLQAVGRNDEAARYSGIRTHRITILAYVLCAVLTGVGGIMCGIDSNSIAPSSFGNFYELYAIAAAVLGGCSLRGGEGSILGVVVGTALMQTLYNSTVLLKIPDELEFTIIGAVILLGVAADELTRITAARFRAKD